MWIKCVEVYVDKVAIALTPIRLQPAIDSHKLEKVRNSRPLGLNV